MAKLSVYVPDDLLKKAKSLEPTLSPSAVLQAALRTRVDERSSRPYTHLSPELEREKAEAQDLIVDRLHAAYVEGYRLGLELTKVLPWEAFESFAAAGWNLRQWKVGFAREAVRGHADLDFGSLLSATFERAGWLPLDNEGLPTGIPAEGFGDAIMDVWRSYSEIRPTQAGEDPGTNVADPTTTE